MSLFKEPKKSLNLIAKKLETVLNSPRVFSVSWKGKLLSFSEVEEELEYLGEARILDLPRASAEVFQLFEATLNAIRTSKFNVVTNDVRFMLQISDRTFNEAEEVINRLEEDLKEVRKRWHEDKPIPIYNKDKTNPLPETKEGIQLIPFNRIEYEQEVRRNCEKAKAEGKNLKYFFAGMKAKNKRDAHKLEIIAKVAEEVLTD